MNLNDDWSSKIELAGYKGHPGMEKLAKYAPILGDDLLRNIESELVARIALLEDSHPFPSPKDEDVDEGEISIANILRMDCSLGGPVALPLQMCSQGTIVVGTNGSGKTYYVAHLCKQLLSYVQVLIFDRDGQFVDLLGPEIASGKIAVINHSDFKRNLLEPMPNETPLEAINRITSAWRGGLFLRDASENMLAGLIRQLYQERGVFEGGQDYPSLMDLQQALQRMKYKVDAREKEYWQTLRNRVEHLLNQTGNAFDCCKGFDIRDVLGCSMILNLMGLSDSLMRFVVEDLVSCALAYRERFGTTALRNMFVVDEAHRLLAGQSQYRWDQGEALLHTMARTTRKRGIGLILADQVPGQIPSAVMANMGTRIVLRLINGPCIRTVAESMSLKPEERQYIPELERRAILHFPGYPKPFLIQIPELDFSYKISDEEIKRHTLVLLQSLRWVPRSPSEGTSAGAREEGKEHNQQKRASVDKEELDYMEAIARDPFIPATERDKKLGLTAYKGNKIRNDLYRRELIKTHQIQTGKRGKPIVLIEITEEGWKIVESYKVNVQKPRGKGGFLHQFWQHKVQQWYQEHYPGSKPMIEQWIDGKGVDVGVEIDGKRMAVEILIQGEQKEQANIHRDIERGFDEVIFCCEDQETIERLKKRIKDTLGDTYINRVRYKELKEFMA